MNSIIEVSGLNGQPLTIEVIVGMRTARDLRSQLLDSTYALQGNAQVFLTLLFKCGFTPERLAKELAAFRRVVRPALADRVHVVAIDHQQEIEEALSSRVDAHQLQALRNRLLEASTGAATASSQEAVQYLLLRRWLRGLPPIRTADLAVQSGASVPTVLAAIKALADKDVLRTRDRRVALQGFSPDSWQRWLGKSAESPTARYVDRSGSPRTPEKLARTLATLERKDVAIGGVLGALHHYPALDITGAPRLDIVVHGTPHADLSFIEQLDPGLVRDDAAQGHAQVVVHFANRRESHFDIQKGAVWADVLDCLVHLWKGGLTHQAQDLMAHLTQQANRLKGQ